MRILAVTDDHQALRYRHISDALVKAGYAITATTDPDDLFGLIEQERPDLVLLNLMLPGVDGIEPMKDITKPDGTPVIFESAHGQDQLLAREFEAGGRPLRSQTLLPNGARGPDQSSPAKAGDAGAVRSIRPGQPDHRLRRTPCDLCRQSGPAYLHRVPHAGRAVGERRARADL